MRTLYKNHLLLLILLLCGSLLQPLSAQKQKQDYSIDNLPDSLKNGADAVLRYDANYFDIQDGKKTVFRTKYAYTILKNSAKKYGVIALHYDSFTNIEYIKGTVYNQHGEVVNKLKKSDIRDMSAVNDFSIYEDSRQKIAQLENPTVPYTVEFEFEITQNGLLRYPSWIPQRSRKMAVQESFFQLTFPQSLAVRIQEKQLTQPIKKEVVNGKNCYRWNTANLTTWEYEPYAATYRSPKVYLAPVDFEMDGYVGKMDTWENFGKWLSQLNEGRQDLSDETVAKLKEMVANEATTEAKIAKLYEYLQSKTRYVSIQLGIGGFQPFPASEVDEKGYGDCKALSNYMRAMLESVGIPSHYAIIQAGDNIRKITQDFPINAFNHAILCVPNEKDTIWLECTSQSQAFGAMGSFTDNRKALIITPEGGRLVNTTAYTKEENLLVRNGTVTLGKDGNAQVKVISEYHALQEGDRAYWVEKPKEMQKKLLYSDFDIANFEIADFELKRHKNRIPYVEEALDITVRKCASVSGKRIFLQPNLMSVWESIPETVKDRKSDVELSRFKDFVDIDTMEYHIPKNFHAEYIPEPVEITSPFGNYRASIEVQGPTIIYTRRMEMNKGVYPKEQYPELIEFFKSVSKADKTKIVFVDKT